VWVIGGIGLCFPPKAKANNKREKGKQTAKAHPFFVDWV